ncbi:MAG: ATP-dependent helicase [Rubricoccaceae bacterium]
MRRIVLKTDPEVSTPLSDLTLDYASALDPQQLAAATAGGGPTLVVAGAGTGKTHTLIYRLAYLVETGVPPDQIVLLTFTRRAAREMVARAGQLLDGRCDRVRGGTFHAFCLETLRRFAPKIGYPSRFTVLDASDAADVMDLLRTERGLDKRAVRFPKKRTLQAMASAVTNRSVELADLLEEAYPHYVGHLETLDELLTAFADYKRRYGLMDYDDLLARTLDLLQLDDVRAVVAGRIRHVLVDEYQDVNRLQADLVAQFASVHGNVTAVGDDAQSIYRFRGADIAHILGFPERYPTARVLKLEHNYRSVQPVLDLANQVLASSTRQYDKQLFTDKAGGERPVLVQAPDDHWEAQFVAQTVLARREEGIPLHRQAVLFRSSWCSYAVEGELARRKVPFVKYGGLKLAEAAHIKDLVAYLRIAENPADAVAWNRSLLLLEGVGPKTARRVLDGIALAADGAAPARALGDALRTSIGSVRAADSVASLGTLINRLRQLEGPVEQQVELVLNHYRPHFERVYADEIAKREPDLEAFVALAARHPSRGAFLESLALDPLDLAVDGVDGAHQDEPPLVLSTIHSAKGLEFDTVFLIEALDGVLPSQYSTHRVEDLDEERRLLYVAITRAETELYLSYPVVQYRRGSGQFMTDPSRFLSKVSESLLEPASLVQETPSALPVSPEPRALGR